MVVWRRTPDFWWRERSLLGYALAPLGAIYGSVAASRLERPGATVPIPVICIGNLVLGGAGKTPTALSLAAVVKEMGLAPGFLSRGYGGRETGPVLVARKEHTAADVGDEPLLLSACAPTVVAADRPTGARLLAELGVDIIIMDDGFQNPSLVKDMSLLVVDGARGIGNGRVFPAGPLRAPLRAQLRCADALVVIGGNGGKGVRAAARAGLPILGAEFEPVRTRGFKRKSYLAFAGIGDPGKFFAGLEAAGLKIKAVQSFPDHHVFSEADCESLLTRAAAGKLIPITTEKDLIRLAGRGGAAKRLLEIAEMFPVRVRFEEPRRVAGLLNKLLSGSGPRRKPNGSALPPV